MDVKIMLISDYIGVVLYALLYYTLYHTYELDYLGSGRWRRWRRISVPGWAVVIALVSLCLPPVAVSLSIVSWIIYMLKFLGDKYYEVDVSFIKFLSNSIHDTNI